MGKIAGWRVEYKKPKEIQWGLTTNSRGLGSYVRFTNYKEPIIKIWQGNSIGFPHSGGFVLERGFYTKTQAMKFAVAWMRKHPRG